MFGHQTILLVDDSEDDHIFMRAAFKKASFNWPLQEVYDGDEAIAYLKGDPPYSDRGNFRLPLVMLLDLNMPKKNGFDVLKWVRGQEQFKLLQIIILTASTRPDDVKQAYSIGLTAHSVISRSYSANPHHSAVVLRTRLLRLSAM